MLARVVAVAVSIAVLWGCSATVDPIDDFESLASAGTIPCDEQDRAANEHVMGCSLQSGGSFVVFLKRPDDRHDQELTVAVGLDGGQRGPWLLGANWTAVLTDVPDDVARDLRDDLNAELVIGMDRGEIISVGS